MTPVKRISLVVPMLDEARHIAHFVADVAAQDFAGEIELIVADGGSTDGSVERLAAAAEEHGVALTQVSNRHGWVSQGLNACVEQATGDLIVRLDCHSRYPTDYLRRCALAAEETDALVVGGVVVPEGRTPAERAVACAMDSPFGGIGFYRTFTAEQGLRSRIGRAFGLSPNGQGRDSRVDASTVTYGAFRPQVFELVGAFDESLRRNQDDEFNLRVRLAGGRVVLDPTIRVHYTPRASLKGVFRQYYEYGLWKVPVMLKHREVPTPRSLVPLAFVGSLALLLPAAALSRDGRRLLAVEVGVYGVLALVSAGASVRARRESWSLLPLTLSVFPAFHLGYGIGMVRGWARAFRGRGTGA